MTVLFAILAIVCIKLWNDMSEMRRRMTALEMGGVAPAIPVEGVGSAREASVDVGSMRYEEPPPLPERHDPVPDVAAAPSRVVRSAPVGIRPERRVYEAEEAVLWGDPVEDGSSGLEGLFGRTLPIWAGGVTLAIAGILVVKWSIDVGLLSPAVRVVLGMLFGMGLVGGAEVALRARISDDRIPQSLAGAGVASLYGAVLAANLMYALVGDGVTLAAMVAVTLVAGALSMRFGAPSAVLGLVGGLAAPALVGGPGPDVPLLSVYVAMTSAGATVLARMQGRRWLGGLAMGLSSLWIVALLSEASSPVHSVVLGALMLFVGFAIPRFLVVDREGVVVRTAGAALAAGQTAMLVAAGGFGVVQWTMMAIATAGVLWTSEENETFRDLPGIAFGVLVGLLCVWPSPPTIWLAVVVVAFCALHAAHALRHLAFCECPRLTDGLRLIAIPLTACAMVTLHVSLVPAATFVLWGIGALATAGAIVVVASSGLEEQSAWCQPLAVGMGMVAIAAVLPLDAMSLVLLGIAAALSGVRSWRTGMITSAGACLVWSMPTVLVWCAAALQGVSTPLLTDGLPGLADVATILLPGAGAIGIVAWRVEGVRLQACAVAGLLGMVATHVLWRRVVGISTQEAFVDLGMFDRTGWETILALTALGAWRLDRRLAAGLALASIGHFAWFTGLRFNPLWSEQAVGPVPLLNMVSLSHAVPLALLWIASRADLDETWERIRKGGQMILVGSLGFTLLRQVFAGSVMAGVPMSDGESIMHSVVAIALAVGFLLHGMWTMSVEWRAGSLALMLGAVAKVFLVDAAGLDGLARIVSFAALGFSLIGVGWLYSRVLPENGRIATS